jgi:hypothetical protein
MSASLGTSLPHDVPLRQRIISVRNIVAVTQTPSRYGAGANEILLCYSERSTGPVGWDST